MDCIRSHSGEDSSRGWGFLLVRGLATIAFGVLLWTRPGLSLTVLVLLFDTYVIVDGVLDASAPLSGCNHGECLWVTALSGLVGVGVGLMMTLLDPLVRPFALLFYFALWAIATGALEVVAAIRSHKQLPEERRLVMSGIGEARLLIAGVASLAFGAVFFPQRAATALTALWVLATYIVGFGILLVASAFKVRGFRQQFHADMRSSIALASDLRNSRPKTVGPPERDEVVLVAGLEGSGDANRANLSANPIEGIRAAIPRARRKSNDDVHTHSSIVLSIH